MGDDNGDDNGVPTRTQPSGSAPPEFEAGVTIHGDSTESIVISDNRTIELSQGVDEILEELLDRHPGENISIGIQREDAALMDDLI